MQHLSRTQLGNEDVIMHWPRRIVGKKLSLPSNRFPHQVSRIDFDIEKASEEQRYPRKDIVPFELW